MNIKVRDLKQTETIENNNKLMVLVNDDLNLVKNITKKEFLTNIISNVENNALEQEADGNLYVNTSKLADKIGNLNDLTTENKENLVAAINEAAKITNITLDTLNQSKALETGNVSENSDVLADIIKYKHSLFDRSKIEVVGSPVITDDGIASGFRSSIETAETSPICIRPNIKLSEFLNKSWKIECDFICPDYTVLDSSNDKSYQVLWSMGQTNPWRGYCGGLAINRYKNVQCSIRLVNATESTLFDVKCDSIGLRPNNKYTYVFEYDISTGTYTGTIKYKNEIIITKSLQFSENNTQCHAIVTYPNEYINIGTGYAAFSNNFAGWTTPIDLNSFKISIEGKEVYSCLKTGIDTVKPDDFEVIGSPVISEDGIASGFSANNVLTKSIHLDTSKPHTIICECITPNNNDITYIYCIGNSWLNAISISYRAGTNYYVTINDDTGVASKFTTIINAGERVKIVVSSEDGLLYKLYLYKNNSLIETLERTLTSNITFANNLLVIGNREVTVTSGFAGSIDLNSFKIYSNGNLIYQPCLKIPYTQSKTGSKIVDAIYRDRVQDMYEQFGCAPYYTLQEDVKPNFEVVGSPVVTNDGVASGFSQTDYINTTNINQLVTNAKIKIKIRTGDDVITSQTIIGQKTINKTTPQLEISNNSFSLLWSSNGTDWGNTLRGLGACLPNTVYYIEIIINNGLLSFLVSTDDINYSLLGTRETSTLAIKDIMQLGREYDNINNYFRGSIYLNSFKVSIEGKEVYTPYIQPNFTLPMGEIYGMIEKNGSAISSKLNSDLSNANQAAKNQVISWGLPDYSTGVKLSGSSYTATYKCWVLGYTCLPGAGEQEVYVNGHIIAKEPAAYSCIQFILDVGDVLTVDNGIFTDLTVYAMKGDK